MRTDFETRNVTHRENTIPHITTPMYFVQRANGAAQIPVFGVALLFRWWFPSPAHAPMATYDSQTVS